MKGSMLFIAMFLGVSFLNANDTLTKEQKF